MLGVTCFATSLCGDLWWSLYQAECYISVADAEAPKQFQEQRAAQVLVNIASRLCAFPPILCRTRGRCQHSLVSATYCIFDHFPVCSCLDLSAQALF